MNPRRPDGAVATMRTAETMRFPPFSMRSSASPGRFGSARRVWPPHHLQIFHPRSLLATLKKGGRAFGRKGGSRKGGGGGGGGGSKKGGKHDDDDDDAVSRLIDKYGDGIGQVSFGGVVGFCSGYAMIKVGKTLAFLIGVGFIAAQGLNHYGVVNIRWDKLEGRAKGMLDANGDKKLDKEDAKVAWKRVKAALTKNFPSGGGFATGFALGICCG